MVGARYLEDSRLTIVKRSGIFYARLRISSRKYTWRSLKTTDEKTAIREDRRWLFQLEQRVEQSPVAIRVSLAVNFLVAARLQSQQGWSTAHGIIDVSGVTNSKPEESAGRPLNIF
jgi:hypothetical protein